MINFSDLNLQLNENKNTFMYNNHEIEVLQYLPIEDKNSIIALTLQNSEEHGIYNPLKLEMYLNLYMVYMYTNVEFTEEEQEDEARLFDILESNGFIDQMLDTMEPSELMYYKDMFDEFVQIKTTYRNNIASVLNGFIEELPKNAMAAKDIIEKFNPEDFQQVLNFAFSANGNRPVN